MDNRRKEIKKRIAKRKRNKSYGGRGNRSRNLSPFMEYREPEELPWISSADGKGQKNSHPLIRKEVFLFKLFASACLVLLVAIIYKNPSDGLQPMKRTVEQIMERDFQFAKVASWYEETFGKPLALFPGNGKDGEEPAEYALPANGKILEKFDSDNQGVTFQTEKNVSVTAVQEGVVIFAGKKDEMGQTVIIQHPDSSETWYGKLGEIYVQTYDSVKAGDPVGKVSPSDTEEAGEFYFAVKRDETFVDPVQVINID